MVHVVYTEISQINEQLYRSLYSRASEDRKRRADGCAKREDSLRCLTAEALLNYALGTSEYTVEKHPLGKPYVKDRDGFYYNISHSGSWVVIAFGDSEVGVDVELRDWDASAEKIVRRWFSQEEQNYVLEDEKKKQSRFLQIWTGKESYLKYTGTGLRGDLKACNVLSKEQEVRFRSWTMPDGAVITLCTTDTECTMAFAPMEQLLSI